VKVEQLIVQHLYNNKHVTLQGIGTIHLDPAVSIPQDGDKTTTVPENAFSFEYNLKAAEDEALIDFIVQQTRKIKPLASSDLESFSILAKQFLNIGKPLTIEGIGTILKNQAGIYEFTPGQFASPKLEEAPKQLKEKTDESISFENEAPKKSNSRGFLLFTFFVLIACLTAMGLYYFIFKNKAAKTDTVVTQPVTPATTDTIPPVADSTTNLPDSLATQTVAVATPKDSFNFKIVLKDYPDEAAVNKAFQKLTSYGHKLMVIKADSAKYQLAMPFTAPLSDTVKMRDSLKIFFGGRPYIITQ
jgi:hypothetical protein